MATFALAVATLLAAATSQGRWRFTLSGWALPFFLVVTASRFPVVAGIAVTAALMAVATFVTWTRIAPAGIAVEVGQAITSGVVIGLAVALALAAGTVASAAGALSLAAVVTLVEIASARQNPFGEWGSLAHSHSHHRWVARVGRLGPAAVTFVIVLIGGGLGFAWVGRDQPGDLAVLLATVLAAVAAIAVASRSGRSQARLDLPSTAVEVVGLMERDDAIFDTGIPAFIGPNPMDQPAWEDLCRRARLSLTDLLDRTRDAGEHGADLIVWAEGAGVVSADGHDDALRRAAQCAQDTETVVIAAWLILDRDVNMMRNTASVILADGTVASTYDKAHPVPGPEADHTASLPSKVEAVETDFGRIGIIICFDADHPDSWQAIRQADVDIVVIPASDWPAIGAIHSDMARLRSRSADAALIRVARQGCSVVLDDDGCVLASTEHRAGRRHELVASLPVGPAGR